jgi:hypothetical protein
MKHYYIAFAAALLASGCATTSTTAPTAATVAPAQAVGDIADAYIKLTLDETSFPR